MDNQELNLYQTIVIAISGIVGVIIGAIITTVFNWKLKTKEVKLRVAEKVFDKRISAHEDIMKIPKLLRTVIQTYKADKDKNALTYPAFLHNRESFDDLLANVYSYVNNNSHWLDIEIFRELNYLQDYLCNLDTYLRQLDESKYAELGVKIKKDIIDLASSLEKITLKFFKEDIYNINLKVSEGHHKYPKEETLERLNKTELLKIIDKIA